MANGLELLNIKKPIVILGKKLEHGMFTAHVRALWMAHQNGEGYKQLWKDLENNAKAFAAIDNEESDPLEQLEIARVLKSIETETKKLNSLMNDTPEDEWTDKFHSSLQEKAKNLKSEKEAIAKRMNYNERRVENLKQQEELVIRRKRLDLEFVASLISDDVAKQKELLDNASEEDALLAHDWIVEGNALLTRSDVSLPLNRVQRRASQRVAN